MLSPEIPLLSQPPPTSTTQRAEADSQSSVRPIGALSVVDLLAHHQQDHSVLNSQIVELTAALEEREGKLSQLEGQIEELQEHIQELERESVKVRTQHASSMCC